MKHRRQIQDRQSIVSDDDWMLWQLADSALPAGGFAHSGGLEAAWQHGQVQNSLELGALMESSLRQLGQASLPFVTAAHDDPACLATLDKWCDSFITNHVANRASRLQGRAFVSSTEKIFPGRSKGLAPCGHFAPVFGATSRALGVERSRAARLFFFLHLRGLIAAAIRLGIVGPMEGQALQHRLSPVAGEILAQCEGLPVEEAAQTAPLLEIWQATQDRLYSRLFQS
ncbi:MAG TPA: urease accessory UreF family protein [Candidatus Cybelea sp.]|nr:urease accessory UreF family protein [Candidatus Cybelea sp.]